MVPPVELSNDVERDAGRRSNGAAIEEEVVSSAGPSTPKKSVPPPPTENTRLLNSRPSTPGQRPSYRKRRLSQVTQTESSRSRWYMGVCGGVLGLALILIGGGLIILKANGGRKEGDGDRPNSETPDYSRLPPPQPGLRNPNYLASGYKGAVASEVDVCSEIGVDVLKDGGTAADAAIATTLCIGTTNMFSSGIGGGGFMIIRPPSNSSQTSSELEGYYRNPNCTEPLSIDFRETAPTGSHAHMFSARKDDPTFDAARASRIGGLAVGVPGELRGLEAAYTTCGGGVSWERLVKPSVDLARKSKVGKELGRRLNMDNPFGSGGFNDWILDSKEWKDIFAPEGKMLKVGETLRRENYAKTLETIAKKGASAFYEGDIAESMIQTIRDAGGWMTLEDLASYKAQVKPASQATYRNRTYYTGYAPSAGPVIQSLLNTLEGYKGYADKGRTGLATHRFVESLKFAFAARTEIGDPSFIHNGKKLSELVTKDFGDRVRANITDDHTHTLPYYNPHFNEIQEDHGTTHLSVIDKGGSAVSLTSTVNLIFGSRVLDVQTGVIMNDEMDDFATPDVPDAFGLQPSPFNFPEAGKRPLSSTSPLIMDSEDGEVYLTLGGSGGSRIFGAVAQVILNLDWGMDVANAVEQSRVHDQLSPAYVSIESGYRPDLIEALITRGHNITMFDVNLAIAEVQAVVRHQDGKLFATSDSRKNGVPAAY